MLSSAEKIKFLALGAKYKINISSHVPGYIMLTIGAWNGHKEKIIALIDALEKHAYVKDITFDNAVVEIYYDNDLLENPNEVAAVSKLITESL